MSTTQHITTAQELLEATGLGRCELIRGELIMMSPTSSEHARIVIRFGRIIDNYLIEHPIGTVYGGDPGFITAREPDSVLAPDLAFLTSNRAAVVPKTGFIPGAPDLAIEVLSPNDSASEVLDKVHDWLDAGCLSVWVVDPVKRTITVHRPKAAAVRLTESDTLTAEDILPGFCPSVAEVFR